MKHLSNVKTSQISWLSIDKNSENIGKITDLYYPETMDELIKCIRQCQMYNREYFVFGHTSNSYFLPSFAPEVVISIVKLKSLVESDKLITVECGMPTKALAKMMVENGYIGFEGLIDLPGTVSGAVYGNAGCYGCLISDHLVSAKILTPTGEIMDLKKEELNYKNRTSSLKEGFIKGTILSATFEKIIGDKETLIQQAHQNHANRMATQPGPANNLGSIFKKDKLTKYGNCIRRVGRYAAKILRIPEESHTILKLKLYLVRYPSLDKYLFDLNRFMWVDKNAHTAFDEYLKLRKKLYRNNNLEIEIFK